MLSVSDAVVFITPHFDQRFLLLFSFGFVYVFCFSLFLAEDLFASLLVLFHVHEPDKETDN